MKKAKKEFEDLVYQGIKSQGMDELSSRLIGMLYAEANQVTLVELTKKTGYSFSAVSAAMKMLTMMRIVNTTRKGGSKKLYFSVQRDMLSMTLEAVKKKNELMVEPAIKNLPDIISRCKKNKGKGSEELQQILEGYYQQMKMLGKILTNLSDFTKKIQQEAKK